MQNINRMINVLSAYLFKLELCKVDGGLNAADMLTKHVGVGVLKI